MGSLVPKILNLRCWYDLHIKKASGEFEICECHLGLEIEVSEESTYKGCWNKNGLSLSEEERREKRSMS